MVVISRENDRVLIFLLGLGGISFALPVEADLDEAFFLLQEAV
jgi:hypothetical protein